MSRIWVPVAYGTLASSAGIALTATSGWLIVRASEQPIMLTLLTAIVAVRAFGMARPFFRYLERLASHDIALEALARRRTSAYRGLIPLTPARLGQRSHSEVLTGVVDDLTDVAEAPARAWVPGMSAGLSALVATILAAVFLPLASAVMLAYVLLVALVVWWGVRHETTAQARIAQARQVVAQRTDLVVWQAREIAAIGAGAAVAEQLATAQADLAEANSQQARARGVVTALLVVATAAAALVMGAVVLAYGLDAAAVGAPIAALLVLLPVATGEALSGLPDVIRSLVRASAARDRVNALLEQRPAVADEGHQLIDSDGVPQIELDHLSASWVNSPGATSPDLNVDRLELGLGKQIAVMGPNGSGKSTLLAVLARQLDPSSGSHRINGREAADLDLAASRALIASTGDEPHLFNTTVAKNLLIAQPEATEEQMSQALADAGLAGWLSELPSGLHTRLGVGGQTPSAGERSRLALARAVLSGRGVLLLDEPTAHLDHHTAASVMARVRAAWGDKPMVLVTHRGQDVEGFADILDLGDEPGQSVAGRHHAGGPAVAGPTR